MSKLVTTQFGVFNHVKRDGEFVWMLQCPGCGQHAPLDDDQWNGRISVDHDSEGCPGHYHETHDFAKELQVVLTARLLTMADPYDAASPDAAAEEAR